MTATIDHLHGSGDGFGDLAGATATTALAALAAPTLVATLAATCARHATEPALVTDGDGTLTYAQLWDQVDRLATRLHENGIGRGDRIGIRIPGGTSDLYVAILAVLRAGAAYVPVDADDPDERAATVFDTAAVAAILGPRHELTLCREPVGAGDRPEPGDDAWIIFTSGSTGAPKGVAVSHRSAVALIAAESELWTVGPGDRVLAGLSVSFDASCEEMWTAWAHGAALVPAPRSVVRSGAELGPWLREHAITVVSTVPTLAAMWPDDVLDTLRVVILGGEALPADLATRLASRCETWNTYGPTEATVVTTAARVIAGRDVTIGSALTGWRTAVVDELELPVEPGETGELVIGGVGLGRYLDPELDAVRYAANPVLGWDRCYRTGDLVRETADGYAFLGRRDDQVKLGGRRIELGEIDAHLTAAPGVRIGAAAVQRTDAGNPVLVGYICGDADLDAVRQYVAQRLSGAIAPLVVALDELPLKTSGKVDRKALPWPPPAPENGAAALDGATQAWLAERWREQLGPLPIGPDSDFFTLGGTSVAVAKLVSVLRESHPLIAVADVYEHRTLAALATLLDELPSADDALAAEAEAEANAGPETTTQRRARRLTATVQITGVLALLALMVAPWLADVLAFDNLFGGRNVPHGSWYLIVAIWLLIGSLPGRLLTVAASRRLLLRDLQPGRYSRHSSLARRLWFVDRLGDVFHVDSLGGTPWAARFARLAGLPVDPTARLSTVPDATSLARIGAGATVEGEVDMKGWIVEGDEIVVGEITIGAGARIGQRACLAPGAIVECGAEVEPGSVVTGDVPAGVRVAGSPAVRVGSAGELWPLLDEGSVRRPRRGLFLFGLALDIVLPLLAAVPMFAVMLTINITGVGLHHLALNAIGAMLLLTPLMAAAFLITYAVLLALAVRIAGHWIRPGIHRDDDVVGWALWFTEHQFGHATGILFSLFSTVYTRPWLRLAGIQVGRGTEFSTVTGLSHLVTVGAQSFSTDDVCFVTTRARDGWIDVRPITIGDRTFLGNGAIVPGGTTIGSGCLIGAQTLAPTDAPDGTSWFGTPALELPRIPIAADVRRTFDPPLRLRIARASVEIVRIVMPFAVTVALGLGMYQALVAIAGVAGVGVMALVAAPVILIAALIATAVAIVCKWVLIGRYKVSKHPLWSFFIWRDEIINSVHEQLAGQWLLRGALGTPIVPLYLRLMGARIGRDTWFDSIAMTEFDMITVGDRCALGHAGCIETHLFQDRVLQIGPAEMKAGSSLATRSTVMPDTVVGTGTHLGQRSVLMRGESLPAASRWLGVPVRRA